MLTIIWIDLAARAQKWQRETDRQRERGEEHMGAGYYSQATHSNCLQVHKASNNQTANSNSSKISRRPSHSRQSTTRTTRNAHSVPVPRSVHSIMLRLLLWLLPLSLSLSTADWDRRPEIGSQRPKERERPEQRRHSVRQMPITV